MPYGTRDFLANPLAFMDDNIIVPNHAGIGTDQTSAKFHELCLVLSQLDGKKDGRAVPVCMLRKVTDQDPFGESMIAYWCPYNQNQTLSCTLGNGARLRAPFARPQQIRRGRSHPFTVVGTVPRLPEGTLIEFNSKPTVNHSLKSAVGRRTGILAISKALEPPVTQLVDRVERQLTQIRIEVDASCA